MTVSLTARSTAGEFGIVIASSSPAVAARCVHLRAGVGAVASQNVTNPGLGDFALDALADGAEPPAALAAALERDEYAEYRQLAAVTATGAPAAVSGARSLGINGHELGAAAVAAGNMLAGPAVLPGMLAGFERAAGAFEERLLAGLEAALANGGEAGPLRSAGLAVVDAVPWRVTDLRVDDHPSPVDELRRLVALWLPQRRDYLVRALDPTAAPSYGVPGDE